jgi:hypothetical protein
MIRAMIDKSAGQSECTEFYSEGPGNPYLARKKNIPANALFLALSQVPDNWLPSYKKLINLLTK